MEFACQVAPSTYPELLGISVSGNQPWFTLKPGNWQGSIRYYIPWLYFCDADWQPLPSCSSAPAAWLAVLSAAPCLGLAASLSGLEASHHRSPPRLAQAATLPPGLGRPFQSANNTGEFKLIHSAFPEAKGRKGFLKRKGLRGEVSKGLPGVSTGGIRRSTVNWINGSPNGGGRQGRGKAQCGGFWLL